jgi:hypothetical protein
MKVLKGSIWEASIKGIWASGISVENKENEIKKED